MAKSQENPVVDAAVSRRSLIKLGVVAIVLAGCAVGVAALLAGGSSSSAKVSGFQVVNVYPHDRRAFSQGLVFEDGKLYEGTGQNGTSTLRLVELETGPRPQTCADRPTILRGGNHRVR